ncbi:MAG: AI-2E family transporter [Treponema sp.]|nr:AI-2E family transporter [Treponema sp.]
MKQDDVAHYIFPLLLFLAAVCFVAILKITASVTIPLTIAIFLSFVLQPIVRALTKFRIPWVLATVLVSVLFVTAITLIGTTLTTSIRSILSNYPEYEKRFLLIYELVAQKLELSFDIEKSFFKNLWDGLDKLNLKAYVQHLAISLSSDIYSFGKNLLLVLLLTIFLLSEMSILGEKLSAAFGGTMKRRVIIISSNVMKQVVRFIFIKFFVSLITGILVYIGLRAINVSFAVVWAFAAFVLNFIPIFGSVFSVCITSFFALLQFLPQNYYAPLSVFIFMTAVNFMLGNIIEPKIQSENLSISPFIILASLSLWGWIWGLIGMILAVPFLVIIKIICENVSFLKPIAIILNNKPQARAETAKII